ncbi:uncharacterized protein EMH_0056430 [Eimeria mitis]|uniref:Uncharacterized protein n=1 Tax=Eimeria mitis TaxID=44415 RepID=U6KKN8_9EIME|nr:uncharacterized protein EMH_0056430 [Eimeria mitis]CDJ36023.1 hypothetical protein EMH_0056430 [Eimeria mitis]
MQTSYRLSGSPCFSGSSSCSTCSRCPVVEEDPIFYEGETIHRSLGEEDGPFMMGRNPYGNPYGTPYPPMMGSPYGSTPMNAQGFNNSGSNYPSYNYYSRPRYSPTGAATPYYNQQGSSNAPMTRMGSLGSPYGYTVSPNSGYQPGANVFRNLGVFDEPEMMEEPWMPFFPPERMFF